MEGPATTEITPGDDAARERLEALFVQFDRLTPDELGRIGVGGWEPGAHEELLEAVDAAAARTGRQDLVAEARERAQEAVLLRYSAGSLHPTWIALNWGVSQGRVDDRVGIVQALSDAAAATVVADALDPAVFEALALPAEGIVGIAGGMASEGSLGRALQAPSDPDLGRPGAVRGMVAVVAGIMVFVTLVPMAYAFDLPAAPLPALLAAVLVVVIALRR